jgi:hypothetical protein
MPIIPKSIVQTKQTNSDSNLQWRNCFLYLKPIKIVEVDMNKNQQISKFTKELAKTEHK